MRRNVRVAVAAIIQFDQLLPDAREVEDVYTAPDRLALSPQLAARVPFDPAQTLFVDVGRFRLLLHLPPDEHTLHLVGVGSVPGPTR